MTCGKLFEKIEELYESYLPIWEDICNIESPTNCKEGVDKVGAYVADFAQARGWQVEKLAQPVSGDALCITMNPDALARPVSFSAHMDTVHPIGLFGTPAVRREGARIIGPGVTDDKGGIVAALLAMDALEKVGFTARPVQLLLQSDEEIGSRLSNKQTIHWICEKAKDAVAFLNLESISETNVGTVTLERKGIANYRFEVSGIAAHSSTCATQGASAIREAAHKILELEKMKDADGITCSCGLISGGTAPNSVPHQCEFVVNFRYVTKEQACTVEEAVQKIAATVYVPGCNCTVEKISSRVAMEWTEQNQTLMEKMNCIFEKNSLPVLKAKKLPGGSDAADVTAAGIPCVDNLGIVGGKIHSKDEYGLMESLKDAAKRAAAVAYCI